ncbi:MAG TPA: ECF transporter S component [Candidatus Limnocylindria bacterium]
MTGGAAPARWRLVDVVVAAVVSAALGVALVAWNATYLAATPLFAALPASQAILYGVWLLPGVLVALIIRRPGAALFAGVVSAAVSTLVGGSPWGVDTLLSGAIQGGGAELAFAAFLYRWWALPVAVLGAALAGLGAAIHDLAIYYPDVGPEFQAIFTAATILSGVLIAGLGGWMLMRALAAAGVLRDFAAGREQREV